jgi:hypothetical protein
MARFSAQDGLGQNILACFRGAAEETRANLIIILLRDLWGDVFSTKHRPLEDTATRASLARKSCIFKQKKFGHAPAFRTDVRPGGNDAATELQC